jgi:glucose-1-phosphate adenylyltransferase
MFSSILQGAMNNKAVCSLPRTQAFILAGGQGERLLPLTSNRPKPAIPFGGSSRIIDFTLSNCLNSKIAQVALLTQYRHHELHRHVHQNWVDLWQERMHDRQHLHCLPPASGKRYRGTADAVFQNLPVIHSAVPEYVLILSGDHVYDMDYRELLARHVDAKADVTIATLEHPVQLASQFGVVEVDKTFRVTGFQEKPSQPRALPSRLDKALVSMGIYVFSTDILIRALIENCDRALGYDFGHHVIPSLINSSRVYAFDFRDEVHDSPKYWRDIGTIDSYYEASMDLARGRVSLNVTLTARSSASVSESARVSHSVLTSGVRIEQGASVENCVLMPGVRVGRGARLRRAIVEEGVQIPRDFEVGWDSEKDRKHYAVSRSGIVIVSETPIASKPIPFPFQTTQALRAHATVA